MKLRVSCGYGSGLHCLHCDFFDSYDYDDRSFLFIQRKDVSKTEDGELTDFHG